MTDLKDTVSGKGFKAGADTRLERYLAWKAGVHEGRQQQVKWVPARTGQGRSRPAPWHEADRRVQQALERLSKRMVERSADVPVLYIMGDTCLPTPESSA